MSWEMKLNMTIPLVFERVLCTSYSDPEVKLFVSHRRIAQQPTRSLVPLSSGSLNEPAVTLSNVSYGFNFLSHGLSNGRFRHAHQEPRIFRWIICDLKSHRMVNEVASLTNCSLIREPVEATPAR
jgi:hypothetical protein